MLGVKAAALAVHAGAGGKDETRLVVEFQCDTSEQCAKLGTLVLHQRLKWSGQIGLRLAGLGPLIDSVATTHPTPTSLVVRAHLPAEKVADLATRYLSMAPAPASTGSNAHPR